MKNLLAALALTLLLLFTACAPAAPVDSPESIVLSVFAAASLTEALDEIIALYQAEVPHVTVVPTYDSSGTLLTQIQEGVDCDLFLSAARKQMDKLDTEQALLSNTQVNLLENKVVLAVPDGNPKHINSFEQLAELLLTGDVLLATGNSDVPVGQYAQKIFAYYQLEEEALAAAGTLTYGSNAKEVTVQVSESVVDCGIVYITDAASAGLTVVDIAAAEMCGQAIYPKLLF